MLLTVTDVSTTCAVIIFRAKEDDYRTGCRNISHSQQQQSYLGLRSPGRSYSTYLRNNIIYHCFQILISRIVNCLLDNTTQRLNNRGLDRAGNHYQLYTKSCDIFKTEQCLSSLSQKSLFERIVLCQVVR